MGNDSHLVQFKASIRQLNLSNEYTNDKHDCISVLVLAYNLYIVLFIAVAGAASYAGQELKHKIVC